jgi:hypothetical protein
MWEHHAIAKEKNETNSDPLSTGYLVLILRCAALSQRESTRT